jgi:membrane protease YdiL (CAAX protease family)
MSIWMEHLLMAAPALPTTDAVAATTRAATLPLSVYREAIAEAGIVLIASIVIFFATYGRRRQTWAPRRVADVRKSLPLWLIAAAMVWCFLAVPNVFMLLRQARSGTTRPASDAEQVLAYAITCGIGLLLAAALHWAFQRGRTIDRLGLVPLTRTLLPGRAAVAILIAVPLTHVVAAASMLLWQVLQLEHESAHAMLQLMQRNETKPWVLWLTIFNATLLAPLFEEVLFRGHIQTALTAALPRWRWPAIVLTSLLFASIHDGWTAPAIFALSVAIGVAYEWSGSLWVAIAVHVAFNAVSTVGFLAGQ